ncbi:ATP-binding protein involved in chromosome partitioning [Formivibrio citricus]|uniref:Iron-sulfur cluster carrier protein n=1 Tax=Formivibrio citricus TaxID=83765 RepID=A0A1I4XFM9_9NEIS|nr:iron-sulfur cluster carrier protein ApbC [Formivibrio citricus]SFN24472.1 ATP-binding protein involved in chromosome partitioning [Formivibrio citricus]
MPTLEAIQSLLAELENPDAGKSYASARCIKNLKVEGGAVSLDVVLGYPGQSRFDEIRQQFEAALTGVDGVKTVQVNVSSRVIAHAVQPSVKRLGNIKNIIAVASGKGGVGKSTTAANLALALAAEGAQVGLLDADIYGPSLPQIMGLTGVQPESDGETLLPLQNHGVKLMSIGALVDPEQPMIWRAPIVTQALMQIFNDTHWGELDYLVVDLPPGTGDIQLTLSQKVPVTGAVIVTTPQDIALLDARKGLKMFEKVNIPILGIVENMSMHVCSNCGHVEPIFGEGGGAKMCADYDVALLGQLPLDLSIRLGADSGLPSVVAEPDGKIAGLYKAMARKMAAKVAEKAQDYSSKLPPVVVQK